MSSKKHFDKIGVIGAGKFGTVISNILSYNANEVVVYVRSQTRIENFNTKKINNGYKIEENVRATTSIEELTNDCTVLFALVPSKFFRGMIRDFSPYLRPDHIIIHGTKGVDVVLDEEESFETLTQLSRDQIHTMSEVIQEETVVRRIGVLAGPNLSGEIAEGQPAGAIVASMFDEVIQVGKQALTTERFKIFSSKDILGAEFAGVLKNIFAISSGILEGLGFGFNARALLITKGLHEMLYIGNRLGADTSAFLGIAGIGDLVATCSSDLSRNFTVGKLLAQGNSLAEIREKMKETAEGVRSVKIFHTLSKTERMSVPFTETLYRVLYEDLAAEEAIKLLMSFKYSSDVSFL